MPTQQDSTESLGYSILPTYSIGNFLNDFKKQPTIFADIKDQMREKKCSAKDAMNDMILSSRDNERTRILKYHFLPHNLPTIPTYLRYLPTYDTYLPTIPTCLHYLPRKPSLYNSFYYWSQID